MARLHIEYEAVEPFPLKYIETTGVTKNKPTAQKASRGYERPLAYGRGRL